MLVLAVELPNQFARTHVQEFDLPPDVSPENELAIRGDGEAGSVFRVLLERPDDFAGINPASKKIKDAQLVCS